MFEVCESISHSLYGASKFMQLMFTLLFQYGGQFYLLVTDQRCLNRSCLVWEKFTVVWDQLRITCWHQSYFLLIKASKGKIKTVKCTRNKFFVVYSFEENLFPSFNMVLSEKQDKDEVHFHRNQKSCHLTFTITLSWISLMGLNWQSHGVGWFTYNICDRYICTRGWSKCNLYRGNWKPLLPLLAVSDTWILVQIFNTSQSFSTEKIYISHLMDNPLI